MSPLVRGLLKQIAPDMLQQIDLVTGAVGAALTPEQQLAVSAKVVAGPGEFIAWSETDVGRAAIREFADKFTGVAK